MTKGPTVTNKVPEIRMPGLGRRGAWGLGAVALAALLLAQSVRTVPAGHTGVIFNTLSGNLKAAQPGIHLVVPMVQQMNIYDARLQEVTLSEGQRTGTEGEGAIRARSKEGLDITADVTVQFRIDQNKAAILHKELGRNYMETVIRPQVRSKVRDAIGQFSAADLISTERKAVETTITEELNKAFSRNYLVLDSVLLRELRIPDSVAKAIEEKQTAEQQVAVEKNRLQQANISAQRAVVEAEGKAKAAVATAKGEAEALSLRGRALRQNPQLIQLTVAEKLAPGIKSVVLPSDGNYLLNVSELYSTGQTAPAPKNNSGN